MCTGHTALTLALGVWGLGTAALSASVLTLKPHFHKSPWAFRNTGTWRHSKDGKPTLPSSLLSEHCVSSGLGRFSCEVTCHRWVKPSPKDQMLKAKATFANQATSAQLWTERKMSNRWACTLLPIWGWCCQGICPPVRFFSCELFGSVP